MVGAMGSLDVSYPGDCGREGEDEGKETTRQTVSSGSAGRVLGWEEAWASGVGCALGRGEKKSVNGIFPQLQKHSVSRKIHQSTSESNKIMLQKG